MAKIELQNIGKRFGDTPALQDINLTIADGEFVVFVGPSGCGKSTLLRLIAGLEGASCGRVLIDGADVTDIAAAKRGLSMVFQSYGLYPHMSVWNNMAFGLKMAKTPAPEIERRVRAAADTLQLSDYLHRKPRQLSGGQRQRVAIGRAIVREPRGFLFDEPLSNLDAALRVQMRLEIVRLQRRLATTAIYVTHDQVEAMTMAQRIVVLNGGRVEQTGAPLQIYRQPANLFVAGFIGSPRMNFIGGESAAQRDAVTLGIRPEHLHLRQAEQGEWTGEVENTEHLGADAFAHVRCEGIGLLTARVSTTEAEQGAGGGALPAAGERVGLRANEAHVHLFDADGAALPCAAAAASADTAN